MLGLEHFLILSAVLFTIGLYGVLSRRNAITVLMCIEIMFNAVNVAMVALSRYSLPAVLAANPNSTPSMVAQSVLTGQIFAVFIITVAAAEVALGLAIIIAIYRARETIDLTDLSLLRR
jgi:NADH:ubiquinone oxidoreductase subunit K